MIIAGIDEAGRGPVIGDMFVAIVVIDREVEKLFQVLGVRDSKQLTPRKREELFGEILRYSRFIGIRRYPPHVIDRENLNRLFLKAVVDLTKIALKFVKRIDAIFIDVAGKAYEVRDSLRNIGFEGEVFAEHGADERYIVTSAASIVAKYLRDEYVAKLRRIYGDFGSGYPSDPKTIKWLKQWVREKGHLPPIVRRSWSTVSKVASKTLDEYMTKR